MLIYQNFKVDFPSMIPLHYRKCATIQLMSLIILQRGAGWVEDDTAVDADSGVTKSRWKWNVESRPRKESIELSGIQYASPYLGPSDARAESPDPYNMIIRTQMSSLGETSEETIARPTMLLRHTPLFSLDPKSTVADVGSEVEIAAAMKPKREMCKYNNMKPEI